MTRACALALLLVPVLTAAVVAGAAAMADGTGRAGAVVGGSLGGVFQLLLLGLAVLVAPRRRLLAFGLGMLGRFALVAFAALMVVPRSGLPPAPLLLTLVTVLFVTTLLEPAVLADGATHGTR